MELAAHAEFTDLPSAPPHQYAFTPNGPDEWNGYTLSIPYEQFFTENFRLMFEFESRLGNNIFLDDINIEVLTASDIEEREQLRGIALSVYPNPTSSTATLAFNTHQPFDAVSVDLFDLTGRHMWNGLESALPVGTTDLKCLPPSWLRAVLLVVEADGRRSATQLMVSNTRTHDTTQRPHRAAVFMFRSGRNQLLDPTSTVTQPSCMMADLLSGTCT